MGEKAKVTLSVTMLFDLRSTTSWYYILLLIIVRAMISHHDDISGA